MAKKITNRKDPAATATTVSPPGYSRGARLFLLIFGDEEVRTQLLPEHGEVIVGRSERCDVEIHDPSISRQHARLEIGPTLTLEDLGSANGSAVGGAAMAARVPVPIAENQMLSFGNISAVVQRRTSPLKTRRIWGHDYFEGRLAEECARAEQAGEVFTLLRLHFESSIESHAVRAPFAEILRDGDVLGLYGPSEYEILLVGAARDEGEVVASRLAKAFEAIGQPLSTNMAHFPADGRDADGLMAAATGVNLARESGHGHGKVVLADPAMKNLYGLAERVAVGKINVLILGETGSGKQVLAETIHARSSRAGKPFLELNCSAFTETLLESELFGHEKGAFTGATQSKPGLLETANGGTVFLDEIGDMGLALQAKLLRVIENGEVLRVGGLKPRRIDVRFVAATNRELEDEIVRGTFRQDLFFRINGVTLQVPPLRERSSEIEELAVRFAALYGAEGRRRPPGLSREALELLLSYTWPGNIRELRNVIERACLLCTGSTITPEHLPVEKMSATFATNRVAPAAAVSDAPSASPHSRREGDDEKKRRILEALMQTGGNNTEAAKLLGVSRRTLGKWLETYGLPRPRKGRSKG